MSKKEAAHADCFGYRQFARTVGNYDPDRASHETGFDCSIGGPSMAVQSQKEEADINTIVRNFGVTGLLPQNVRVPTYDDFSGVSDYREAIHAVRDAEESFMRMPSAVRSEFENDPQKFLEFCMDKANLPRMRELGLAVPLPVQENPPA